MAAAFGFILGAILGSFVGAAADRSLKAKSLLGRSYCPRCYKTLRWYDLFPIFSFILLRGRCRYCKKLIGLEYLLVELVMGLLIGYLFYQSNLNNLPSAEQTIQTIFDLSFKIFFITILGILFITDLKEMLIPNKIVIPTIWIAIISLALITIYKIGYLYYSLSQNPIGKHLLPPGSDYFTRHAFIIAEPFLGSIAAAVLIATFFAFLIAITRGRGMGGGDVKLGLLMGLGLGFPGGILATILGFLGGSVIALLAIILGKKNLKSQIPFGPFLVLGSLATLFLGQKIIDWYLRLST